MIIWASGNYYEFSHLRYSFLSYQKMSQRKIGYEVNFLVWLLLRIDFSLSIPLTANVLETPCRHKFPPQSNHIDRTEQIFTPEWRLTDITLSHLHNTPPAGCANFHVQRQEMILVVLSWQCDFVHTSQINSFFFIFLGSKLMWHVSSVWYIDSDIPELPFVYKAYLKILSQLLHETNFRLESSPETLLCQNWMLFFVTFGSY